MTIEVNPRRTISASKRKLVTQALTHSMRHWGAALNLLAPAEIQAALGSRFPDEQSDGINLKNQRATPAEIAPILHDY